LIDTDGMSLASGLAHEVYRSAGFGPDMQARIAAFHKRP
jgi:enoyl-CoA hydratase